MNSTKLTNDLSNLLETMNGEFVPYAITYAQNIQESIEMGARYGYSPQKATKTQLLYVLSNLSDQPREVLEKVAALATEHGIDIQDTVEEILTPDEDA